MTQERIDCLKGQVEEVDKEINRYKARLAELEAKKNELLASLQIEEEELISSQDGNTDEFSDKQGCPLFLNKSSSVKEKSEFLLNLFYSRRDVYAVRFKTKDKRTMYSPKCLAFWSEACRKKQHKDAGEKAGKKDCEECPFKSYDKLTADVITKNNLMNDSVDGINAVGIYPIFNGDCVRFVAFDFDEDDWEKSSRIVVEVARKQGFEAALERSFSGNGAHVWIFFKEDVKAKKARKMAFSILDKACEKSGFISFRSFDRIFPMQDSVPEDGLGNLILMPLVKSAATRKDAPTGTVFVIVISKCFPIR